MTQDLASAYAHCENVLRQEDRDAWLAALFAPADRRQHLHVLGAFFTEIRRVRDRVRQPLAGELRLQWWRDAIEGETRGDAEANPVAAALLDTAVRADLSRGMLVDAIEAHRTALYGEAPATMADLERFFDRTTGALLRCEIRVLAGPAGSGEDAVPHAAAALGIADLFRHLGHYLNRGFGVIPEEILDRHGMARGALRLGDPALGAVLTELRRLARRHLADFRAARSRIPEPAVPALLPLSLVEPLLRLSERSSVESFGSELVLPQWRRQWSLWRASRRGLG